MKRILLLLVVSAFAFAGAHAQSGFTFDDLMNVRRVGDPQLSPDGKTVAYTVGVVNKAENRTLTQIYTVNIDGSNVRQITKGNSSSSSPRWSPDGRRIAYVTGGQIWTMESDGDDTKQVTRLSTGAGNPVWSPNGRWIAFSSEVYPECDSDACNKSEEEKAETSKVKAKVAERLLFKHWNEWRDRKRAHVFVIPSDGGIARDVTPGDYDSPPYAASSGVDYAFSPDNSEIAFLRNPDKIEAISTNSDIYVMPLATGGTPRNITAGNKGYDASPVYTPDGKYILFRSQATATFEADRWRIMRYDRRGGQTVELTRGFDNQVDEFTLAPDGKTIYFAAGTRGKSKVYSVPLEPDMRLRVATHVKPISGGLAPFSYISNLNPSPDGGSMVFLSSSIGSPAEVFVAGINGISMRSLTRTRASVSLPAPEELEWKEPSRRTFTAFCSNLSTLTRQRNIRSSY